jgi:hypothetical protein
VGAPGRDALIQLDDAALEAQCEVDRYRASGPGGQHRNKTESAIRLRHRPTGVIAHADERRSQAENRVRAVHRLREHLAFEVREPVALDTWAPSAALAALVGGGTARLGEKTRQTAAFFVGFAALLDVFAACGAEVANTAARLGLTTGACSKLLLIDERTSRAVNQLRAKHGLRPLR